MISVVEPEVTAAWISAVGALGGVALGTITGVLAARIQARPAHRAAEAAYAQAESAYRAALDSAREQIRPQQHKALAAPVVRSTRPLSTKLTSSNLR